MQFLKIAAVNVAVLAILLMAVEGFFYLCIRHPALLKACPSPLRNVATGLYKLKDQRTIQFLPECARYDPGVTYTLKPGQFVFSNREFQTRYRVNSLGLRDTEAALHDPEIVVAGDSNAMGWGVEQEETFAKQLEKMTGWRVLNTAIASYGTVREMKQVARVHSNQLKFLVIQYCDNDYGENFAYYGHNNVLDLISRQEYEAFCAYLKKDVNSYYPGKYLVAFFTTLGQRIGDDKEKPPAEAAVAMFLNALESNRLYISNARIVVFEINGMHRYSGFIPALKKRLAEPRGLPDFIRDMIVVDFSNILERKDYLLLDDHLNRAGHLKIARTLEKIVGGRK